MISESDARPFAPTLRRYQAAVASRHPTHVASWPLLNGWNILSGTYGDWHVYVLRDADFTSLTRQVGLGELSEQIIGAPQITGENRAIVRSRLEKHFNVNSRDAVVLWPPNNDLTPDLIEMLFRHESALGLSPMKIFLSHSGADKPMVRDYKETLAALGFQPWLDEDAMAAGTNLERGILKGFADSCAAVFFVTPAFKDEKFLASEVDYAAQEKRRKGEQFSIITLVFEDGLSKGTVPDLLHTYVWKAPKSPLEALREILRALPIGVGSVRWQ